MRYLLMIYSRETDWAALSEEEKGKLYHDYMTFTEDIRKSGHYVGGNPLAADLDGHDRPRAQRQERLDGRPLRRDSGTARRLLPRRGERSRRSVGARGANPGRQNGVDRGEAHHGHAVSARWT